MEYPTRHLLFLFNAKAATVMLLLRLVVVANVVSLLCIPQVLNVPFSSCSTMKVSIWFALNQIRRDCIS